MSLAALTRATPPRHTGHARHVRQHGQRGAALLLAMLVVTLVATLASAALWQQWRASEVEAADRQRVQASWILTGGLDWARLILREDQNANVSEGNSDHLSEPWATPLEEARLSSFLAVDRQNNADSVLKAFLSGSIVDMQSRLNITNLIKTPQGQGQLDISTPDLQAFSRLYTQLNLPPGELTAAAKQLLLSHQTTAQTDNDAAALRRAPLAPRAFAHLSWLGISPASLARLEPYVTVLPTRTTLNINTAPAAVLAASMPNVDSAQAQYLIAQRQITPFKDIKDAKTRLPQLASYLDETTHSTRSQHFEVRARLRLEDTLIEERSLVARQENSLGVRVISRQRLISPAAQASPSGL